MNLKLTFDKAGEFELASNDMLAPALVVAHVWNMHIWINSAQRALELYTRDRARDGEEHIGNRNVYKTCDDLAYLGLDVEGLKDAAGQIMDAEPEALDAVMQVNARYQDLQSFLQPILWTSAPKSALNICSLQQMTLECAA